MIENKWGNVTLGLQTNVEMRDIEIVILTE